MDKTPRPSRKNQAEPKPMGREELAFLWRLPPNSDTHPEQLEIALRERIKELNCLYGIARLADRCHDDLEKLLQGLVEFLPFSWQYPETTCARIIFKGKTYKGVGFRLTKWRQSTPITMYGETVGELAVFYREERPAADEGPFLKEERALLEEIAERIGSIAIRIAAERELQEINEQLTMERAALKETNAALRAILARIEEEKQDVYHNINDNIEKVIMPILHALAMQLPKAQRKYVELLRTSLEEVAAPFISHLAQKYHSLTPTEMTICNMIKNGMRTKEIAELRGVSPATVNRHREHIRHKLQIKNNKVNLVTHLQAIL